MKTFEDVITSPSSLLFYGLGWTCEQVQGLSRLFPVCRNLRELHLSENQVGNDGASVLAGELPRCGQLQSLSLCSCQIGPEGCVALVRAWTKCCSLRHLYLDDNPVFPATLV